jgi:hypothetical protein
MSKQMADQAAKVNLVGIYLMPEGDWVVEDGSKSLVNKYLCSSKTDVLAKIAEFLDHMSSENN